MGGGWGGLGSVTCLSLSPPSRTCQEENLIGGEGVSSQESVTVCRIASEGGKSNQTEPTEDRAMHANDWLG